MIKFIKRLLAGEENLVSCPRCLGKGSVDWDDIQRLKRELKWIPGTCAYCDGSGRVSSEIVSRVAPDTFYLTTNLTATQRKRLLRNDPDMLASASAYEARVNDFIDQIFYLHVFKSMNSEEIANHFLTLQERPEKEGERKDLVAYIDRVIEIRSKE